MSNGPIPPLAYMYKLLRKCVYKLRYLGKVHYWIVRAVVNHVLVYLLLIEV